MTERANRKPARSLRVLGAALAAGVGLSGVAVHAEDAAKPGAKAAPIEPVVQQQVAADKAASAAQKDLNKLDDETRDMLLRYRQYLSQTENLRDYMDLLSKQVASQEEEKEFVEQQLEEIEVTAQEVTPLMQRMIDTLERFVELDRPFLLQERRDRVKGLKDMMARADVSISEKYRRIMEAYQIETEYGRTLEAWQGQVGEGDQARTVRFLRIGRVAVLYQTMDGQETGYWDQEQRKWVVDNSYRAAIAHGFDVADKKGAPDILQAPVPAPTEVRS